MTLELLLQVLSLTKDSDIFLKVLLNKLTTDI